MTGDAGLPFTQHETYALVFQPAMTLKVDPLTNTRHVSNANTRLRLVIHLLLPRLQLLFVTVGGGTELTCWRCTTGKCYSHYQSASTMFGSIHQ